MSGKIERVAELRSSPETILNVFANKAFLIPTYAPDFFRGVDVQEDVTTWNYTIGGRAEVYKSTMEIDEANSTVTYIAVGGDIMKIYKHHKTVFKLTTKGSGSVLRLTMETEKRNDGAAAAVVSPDVYIDFILASTLRIDAAAT